MRQCVLHGSTRWQYKHCTVQHASKTASCIPSTKRVKLVVRTHFLPSCYERSWDILCPALMCLCFHWEKENNIFFLNSFQLQESQVTELKPSKQHRIISNKDEQERDRTKRKQESACVRVFIIILSDAQAQLGQINFSVKLPLLKHRLHAVN